jgi:hypothetical protein
LILNLGSHRDLFLFHENFEYFIVCIGLPLVTENVNVGEGMFKAIDIKYIRNEQFCKKSERYYRREWGRGQE